MATITQGYQFTLGFAPHPKRIPEANTQSFVNRAGVYVNGGKVTALANADPALIYGWALANANNNTAGAKLEVQPIIPGQKVVMNVYHSVAASAVTARTQLGVAYGIYIGAAGQIYCDIEDTGNTRVRVVGFYADIVAKPESGGVTEVVTDQYGRVIVEFLDTYLQYDEL